MKILIVSNLYPPYFVGGYELRCSLVAEALRRRGHDVRVVTSSFGLSSPKGEVGDAAGVPVHRILRQYHHGPQRPFGRPYFLSRVRPQLKDARRFIRMLDAFKPDIVNWWSVGGLTKAILHIPKYKRIPDVFWVEDDWIIEEAAQANYMQRPPWAALWQTQDKPWYWQGPLVGLMESWTRKLLNKGVVTSPAPFSPEHVCFVSEAIRADYESQGLRFPSAEVIHGGVSAQQFFYDRGDSFGANKDIRLLYAGQLTADRGLHTAIEAFRLLPPEARSSVTLTVVGESFDLNYQRQVHQQVQEAGLSQNVSFVGKKTYAEMSEVYRTHAILLAPSLRKEGFPLTMVEAMLSGCAVVTSGSGGAIEIAKPAIV